MDDKERRTQPAKKGDRFRNLDVDMRVIRASVTHGWVDVRCHQQGSLASWSKRMPEGIPSWWERLDGGS